MNRPQSRALLQLREMILQGTLAPGQRLAEAPLAQLLGMSRTPIRQALPVLAREGLLVEHETRGYVVRGVSIADILDAIDVRGVLEGLAARRVAETGPSRTLLDALRVCLTDGDHILEKGRVAQSHEALFAEMNARFHRLILAEARSPTLEQALERISHVAFASPQAVAFDKTSVNRMYALLSYAHQQHHYIVAALERRESARAEALMREHTNPVKESLNLTGIGTAQRDTDGRLALARRTS